MNADKHRLRKWTAIRARFPNTARSILFLICVHLCSSAVSSSAIAAPKTVAADGTGQYKTVQSAVDAVPSGNAERIIIHVKPGTYHDRIAVPRDKPMITLLGDDPATTILSFDRNSHASPAAGSSSGSVAAADFTAENITFENTAGDTGQAQAMTDTADRQIFRNCRFVGWQDTLYINTGRMYFDKCYISGRVDFIYGSAIAIFDHCEIHTRNGGHITAASTAPNQPWGFVFLDCKITGDGAKSDLGRPWRPNAAVAFVRCELSDIIKPVGWSNWVGNEYHKTARFFEYKNTGPGADRTDRQEWTKELTDEQAKDLTVEKILASEDHWDPGNVK